jgi:hypothetical protein
MDLFEYWRAILAIATSKTVRHFRAKIALGLVIAVVAALFQFLLHVRALSDTDKILISLFGSAAIVMVGAFLWNLFLAPPEFHNKGALALTDVTNELAAERQRSAALLAEVELLKQPRRTPADERYFQKVKAAFGAFSENAKLALAYIVEQGQVEGVEQSVQIPGLSLDASTAALLELRRTDLVKQTITPRPNSAIGWEHWVVVATYEDAIKDRLYGDQT